MMVQNRVKINNNYILSFSMSNYLLYGGGTNLVVSNHQKLFNEHHISYWILRFVLTAAISYIMVYIGQIVLKKHKKLLRYIGFV